MDWSIDPDAGTPPSRQLVERCLEGIARGELAAGTQLPPVRALSALALVNHNTAARAYRELEHLGAVRGEGGRGVFVTARAPELARAWRGTTAWARFEAGVEGALRAGYGPGALIEGVRSAAAPEDTERSA